MFATLAYLDRRFIAPRVGKMLLVLSLVAMTFADFYALSAHACHGDNHDAISAHDAIDRSGPTYGAADSQIDTSGEDEPLSVKDVLCDAAHCLVFIASMSAAIPTPITRTAKAVRAGPSFFSQPPPLVERPPRAFA